MTKEIEERVLQAARDHAIDNECPIHDKWWDEWVEPLIVTAMRFQNQLQSKITPSADVQERAKDEIENDCINSLLAEFKRQGFDTTNWDGDEGWEKAIVDGVRNHIDESGASSLQAENERLRAGIDILKELCQLKHYKDEVGKDAFYEKRQPELWSKANDFLNSLNKQ